MAQIISIPFVDFAMLNKELSKGGKEFRTPRVSMGDDFGQTLAELVKQINYNIKNKDSEVYFLYNIKDYKEVLKAPANFKPSMIQDYIDDFNDVNKRRAEMGMEPFAFEGKRVACKPRKTVKRKTSRKPNMAKSLENAYKRML